MEQARYSIFLATIVLSACGTVSAPPTSTSPPVSTETPESIEVLEPTGTNTPIPSRPEATVVRVIDGDTIEISYEGRTWTVRYIGIDTPDYGDPDSEIAMEANKALVEGQVVLIEQDVSITDQYGRLLLYIYLSDGTFVNDELVKRGFAIAKAYPPDVKYQELFTESQSEAMDAGVGMWASSISTPTSTLIQPSPTTSTLSPSPTIEVIPNVVIQSIYYDGVVAQVESDEYAVIMNNGSSDINMSDWRLNAGAPGQDFIFPDIIIQPGTSCRVYTNEHHPEYCGLSYGSSQPIWNNQGDCGYLFNAKGEQVSEYCY